MPKSLDLRFAAVIAAEVVKALVCHGAHADNFASSNVLRRFEVLWSMDQRVGVSCDHHRVVGAFGLASQPSPQHMKACREWEDTAGSSAIGRLEEGLSID